MAKKKQSSGDEEPQLVVELDEADYHAIKAYQAELEAAKDPAYYILHEDGRKIPCAASELDGNNRQVADLNGRLYYHCGEVNGRWTYREE